MEKAMTRRSYETHRVHVHGQVSFRLHENINYFEVITLMFQIYIFMAYGYRIDLLSKVIVKEIIENKNKM